jgi:hypothetical protein
MRALAITLLALLLSGCGTLAVYVPDELKSCAPQPLSPAGNPAATDADVENYITDITVAGADCRSKLGALLRLLEPST